MSAPLPSRPIRSRRLIRGLGSALAWVLCAAPAAAGHATGASPAYVWRSVTVGGGGYIPQVIFSPVERGLAYARSDMGGAYRFDAKIGRWVPLEDAFAERSWFGVESLAPDPHDPDVVYMAVGESRREPSAILRSADRGATWTVTPVPFRMGGNEDGRGLGERLAIDPADTRVLFFGSRYDGLQRSLDKGAHWTRVAGWPVTSLATPPKGRGVRAGISFVLFAPGGPEGRPSRTLYAGLADPASHHLFRSEDGGETWSPVPGEPGPSLLPMHAALDAQGRLFVTYSDAMGPNGIERGAVWRLDTRSGVWRDITPDRSPNRQGGYIGLALDRSRQGSVMVASADRWRPSDTIWRSTDGGEHWRDIAPLSSRNVSATPFLLWGDPQAKFGWWISALAIDPFDPDHAVYGTGATLYGTDQLTRADRGQSLTWTPWVQGIEQTAVITLESPTRGAQLLSGFGDISGFTHLDLERSPRTQFVHPVFGNTDVIASAPLAPQIVVRAGTPKVARDPGTPGPRLAWSKDGGLSWRPLIPPVSTGDAAIAVTADGGAFLLSTPIALASLDHGQRWRAVKGLPSGSQIVPDAAAPEWIYALDYAGRRLFESRDRGLSFSPVAADLPPLSAQDEPHGREAPPRLRAQPGSAGHLWFACKAGLYRSDDGGRRFTRLDAAPQIISFSFGAPLTAGGPPAIYAIAQRDGVTGVWRSGDDGASWARINDQEHQWGQRFRDIAGDPKLPGRVYVAIDGRGALYGDPAP